MMTDSNGLKILIADDEPLAAERLQMLLARIDDVLLVGTAHDGESAVRMAEALQPDLLLLDIAMPGLDGIEVARALSRQGQSPAVVFVTAFDQFAVAAFDVAAIDYLMKPVDSERLARSIDRARAYLDARVERAPDEAPSAPSQWLEEFWASDLSGLVDTEGVGSEDPTRASMTPTQT
jgi:two-component system response regulator AlgR